jgi:hypothetical protein
MAHDEFIINDRAMYFSFDLKILADQVKYLPLLTSTSSMMQVQSNVRNKSNVIVIALWIISCIWYHE